MLKNHFSPNFSSFSGTGLTNHLEEMQGNNLERTRYAATNALKEIKVEMLQKKRIVGGGFLKFSSARSVQKCQKITLFYFLVANSPLDVITV